MGSNIFCDMINSIEIKIIFVSFNWDIFLHQGVVAPLALALLPDVSDFKKKDYTFYAICLLPKG